MKYNPRNFIPDYDEFLRNLNSMRAVFEDLPEGNIKTEWEKDKIAIDKLRLSELSSREYIKGIYNVMKYQDYFKKVLNLSKTIENL